MCAGKADGARRWARQAPLSNEADVGGGATYIDDDGVLQPRQQRSASLAVDGPALKCEHWHLEEEGRVKVNKLR